MTKPLFAILLDGAFLTKRLYSKLDRHVTVDDIESECARLQAIPQVQEYELLRIYYYDASPSSEQVKLPVSKAAHNLGETERFRRSESIYSQLVLRPYFSLRLGHVILSPNRWKMKPGVSRELIKQPRHLDDDDFLLDISQKGVDMRIGMDMARLALRAMVRAVIVVTGDSDFVPAFKFVRREGIKVYLEPMGTNPRQDLRAHADMVL
jgi:uncharacterized LabA/DUF88 family protein